MPYRANRIEQLLGDRARHDVSTFKSIQADIRSQAALDLMEPTEGHASDDGSRARRDRSAAAVGREHGS